MDEPRPAILSIKESAVNRISRRQCLLGSAALAAGSLLLSCWRAVSPGAKQEASAQANPFAAPGQWYKGAVHVHTTRSDGQLSPQEVMKAHREKGYDFLAITDHNTITDLSGLSDETFLNIPSVEWTYDRNELGLKLPHRGAGRAQEPEPLPRDADPGGHRCLGGRRGDGLYRAHLLVGDGLQRADAAGQAHRAGGL